MAYLWWGHLLDQVCVFLCFFVSCRHLTWTHNIFLPSWWNWMKLFGDIPWVFVNLFQIDLNFLYGCQSVSWLTSLLKLDKCRNISCSRQDIFMKIFGDILRMFLHYFQRLTKFLYVCQSVSWLTSLLKLDKCRDISNSWWDISLIFFGDIPGMLVHYFQMILNFLYVCRSVSWLTFLLKLDKYRDISSSVWDIFLKFFGGIPGMFLHLHQIYLKSLYVCQFVIWLTSLLKLHRIKITPVLDEISLWNFLETFLGLWYTIPK